MKNLIAVLFPQGQRKLIVSLIALVVGVVLEQFGGGLTDNMMTSLIAIVAIFAGGNVGEHLSDALKFLKGTRIGQIVEDIVPGDQGLGESVQMSTTDRLVAKGRASEEEHDEIDDALAAVDVRFNDLENRLAVQTQNINQIVNILNSMRQGNGQPRPPGT